jgi:hypothetical protein
VAETWNATRDALTLQTEGLAGRTYTLAVQGKDQIKSIDGAKVMPDGSIEETFPGADQSTESPGKTLTIHFVNGTKQPASSHH